MFLKVLWCICMWSVDGEVLDPSLFLVPRPPLTDVSLPSPQDARLRTISEDIPVISNRSSSKRISHAAEKARLFWPTFRSSHNIGGSIQIPLTFSLSGLYGKYSPGSSPSATSSVVSSYGTVLEVTGTAGSPLPGASYGNYRSYPGLRIYGGEHRPNWSGWGNGKWGHYGSG